MHKDPSSNQDDDNNDPLPFADERTLPRHLDEGAEQRPWKILVVDDEEELHQVSRAILADFSYGERGMDLLHASSAAEAGQKMQNHDDIAVVLLDMLGTSAGAGLDLARCIREEMHNNLVQIILYTGPADQVVEQEVIVRYEINDYRRKAEINELRLKTTMVTALRAHRQAVALSNSAAKLHEQLIELKRSENTIREAKEEWERTFDAIGDMVMVMDCSKRIVKANRMMSRLTGVNKEQLIGRFCYEVLLDRQSECEECPGLSDIISQRGCSLETDYLPLGKSFQVTMFPILNRDGSMSGIIHTAKDITDRKNLEAQLIQTQKMEAIGTLAGGIAHDFNNILGAIFGFGELAKMDCPEESPIRENLNQILTGAQRAKDLVRQILTFSRQEEIDLQPLEIKSVVKETLKLLRASLPSSVQIKQEISEATGVTRANPTQIHQILMNLSTNALHAMDNKGELTIRLGNADLNADELKEFSPPLAAGPYVELQVMDSGQGMDDSLKQRIFDPFFTTKPKGKGTGMGLSVVHGIVKKHGGGISVASRPDQGTAFRILFPRHTREQASSALVAPHTLPTGQERVLVVDDEGALVTMVCKMLELLGYTVTSFLESPNAMEELERNIHNYDLVITDQTMPELTGLELSRRAVELRPDLPIILCTGFTVGLNDQELEEAGIINVLPKPISITELARVVRRTLDERGLANNQL